jgi:P-type Ca2+ transporter type 2C
MAKDMVENAHAYSVQDVARQLDTDPATGLSSTEIELRLKAHGPNWLRQHKTKGALTILAHQFGGVIVWLLVAAALMSFSLGDLVEGSAIVVVLVLNGAIGFFTEISAARSMEALMRIAEVKTRVRRNGQERMIDARALVPGDLVILEAGDVVTADLRISESANLQADESVLTGEPVPVIKSTGAVSRDAAVGDRVCMAFKATAITQGTGEGLVVATGMDTEIGRISDLVERAESEVAPLEKRLDKLGNRLVWLTFVLAALTIGAGILRGHNVLAMFQTGVALAVAAVPEGLPVVATLSLARGMWRMSQRNAVISQLSSVETLGATTVILTDKTGTLTENKMTVVRYLLDDLDVGIEDCGGDLHLESDGRWLDPGTDGPLGWAVRIGALCTNAKLGDGNIDGRAGDPMELALLHVAAKTGLAHADLLQDFPEVLEHAFDPDAKMMATVHTDGDRYLVAVKGAPEAIIDRADQVLGGDGLKPLDAAARKVWKERISQAGQEGLRLLALAMKHIESHHAAPYVGLTLVGFACLLDPVREDVPAAIAASRAAGVRVVMVTGDHADTAATIARQAGLGADDLRVIEGHEVAGFAPGSMSAELRTRILAADVFARVAPETKLTLVSVYQQAGHVVAMTGDGVNDAPALKKADIGIAMGKRGTQVAQEAAHMVLRDDKFATIISAMRQGRVIFNNIRKFVVYLMSCNVSEVLVVGLAVGLGLPMPLLPLQILFLNLVTDVFPAFALGLGRGDEHVMHNPPRNPKEQILDRSRWVLIGVLGVAITISTLGAFLLALSGLQLDIGAAVTVAFLTLALAQLWNVFNMRDPNAALFNNEITHNVYVWAAFALCLGLVGLALWMPLLAAVLGLPDPGLKGLALSFAASLVPLLFGQIWLGFSRPRKGEVQ